MSEKKSSIIKLTFRQKAFLSKILNVYQEMQEPLHYSIVANRLGVSNSTAYDMLRLLQQKGMVNSQYATPKETSGPGRAHILFSPTEKTMELFSRLAGEGYEKEEWDCIKAHILMNISKGKAVDHQELLRELLNRGPETSSPLVQCAEVITVLLLSLKEAKRDLEKQSSVSTMLSEPVGKMRMSILAGFILGLSTADRKIQRLLGNYSIYTDKCESSLRELNSESLLMLHRFTQQVWTTLKQVSV